MAQSPPKGPPSCAIPPGISVSTGASGASGARAVGSEQPASPPCVFWACQAPQLHAPVLRGTPSCLGAQPAGAAPEDTDPPSPTQVHAEHTETPRYHWQEREEPTLQLFTEAKI